MPELPEVEALRRSCDEELRGAVISRAHEAHVATLKTAEPALKELEGRRFGLVSRRGKHLLFHTDDDALVLHIHQMTAGRTAVLDPMAKRPKTTALRLDFEDERSLVMTERGSRKQARVGLYRPAVIEAELSHLGPEADTVDADRLEGLLRAEGRRLHALLRDQRVLAGIGRAWANEILHRARLSPYALSTELPRTDIERLALTIRETLAEGLALREAGAADSKTYRIHGRLAEPCQDCATPIARVDFERHTIFYCPPCQTGGRVLADRRLSRLLR